MSRTVIFELCAQTLEACIAAREGGADRIELCTALEVDGLTPPPSLIEQAVRESGIPVHVLVRPAAGGFHYDLSTFSTIREQIVCARIAGASGVVVGVLQAGGAVDRERMRELVELARPMEVTFHRAFDASSDLELALEEVIAAGCDRILTSGGAPDVARGSAMLARLVVRAGNRIHIAAGGGLRLANARQIARVTAVRHFHSSLPPDPSAPASLTERVRAMIRILRES